VESIYDICSLHELLGLSSEYHIFEVPGQPIRKLLATLRLPATLVHSDNMKIVGGDPDDPNSVYEFIEIAVRTDKFATLEAKVQGEILSRTPRP